MMDAPSDTTVLAISLHEIAHQINVLLVGCPIDSGVVMDIAIRSWELATIDPVEYYDELRSIVWDELHSHPSKRLRGAEETGALNAMQVLDTLADYTFERIHSLLQLLRPHLDRSIGEYRKAGTYEYNIQSITYVVPTLIVRLLRSDRVIDFYRKQGELK